jgi:hypothetical protein
MKTGSDRKTEGEADIVRGSDVNGNPNPCNAGQQGRMHGFGQGRSEAAWESLHGLRGDLGLDQGGASWAPGPTAVQSHAGTSPWQTPHSHRSRTP